MPPSKGTALQSLAWNMELRFSVYAEAGDDDVASGLSNDYIDGDDILRNGSANDVPYGSARTGLLWEDDTSFIEVPVDSFSDRRSSE